MKDNGVNLIEMRMLLESTLDANNTLKALGMINEDTYIKIKLDYIANILDIEAISKPDRRYYSEGEEFKMLGYKLLALDDRKEFERDKDIVFYNIGEKSQFVGYIEDLSKPIQVSMIQLAE